MEHETGSAEATGAGEAGRDGAGEPRADGEAAGGRNARAPVLRGPAVWPLHPILFAAASVLALYVTNLRQTHFADVLPALATAVGCAALLFLAFGAALRGFGTRAAVAASIVVVTVLYYDDLFARLNGLLADLAGDRLPRDWAAPLALLVAAGLMLLAIRSRRALVVPNALLNGIAFVLLATPVWTALSHAWETASLPRPAHAATTPSALPAGAGAAPATAATPDIYHFIFDRYGSEETLARVYGIDNGPFLDSLRARGFYVASESFSNYPKTAPSLAATFHMDYLDFLRDDPLALRNEWHPIYDMLESHDAGAFLQAQGYRTIQIGSWWEPTQANAGADESYSFGFSEFAWIYLQRTLVPTLAAAVAPGSGLAGMMAWDSGQCRRVPLQIAQVKAIAERPEATYTFIHVLLPHEPYIFAADGRCLSREEMAERGRDEGYAAQLAYANRLIDQAVDSLLAGPDKPVIILQADEGPYPESFVGTDRSWTTATPDELATKSGILNAWYLPDGDYSALDQTITPVNTYRVLFDKYFGTSLGRLPDRTFHFPDYGRIYDFFEVTDQVRRVQEAGS